MSRYSCMSCVMLKSTIIANDHRDVNSCNFTNTWSFLSGKKLDTPTKRWLSGPALFLRVQTATNSAEAIDDAMRLENGPKCLSILKQLYLRDYLEFSFRKKTGHPYAT